ncbi:MAG: acetylglutamate kinase [Candidatus Omnitrophica bacterium]|nr:acetylglutamate kinase [Candidatus Omnitrophota bacterium]MDD5775147.1 acetylglutamate kinase [Candidatus Omnitrophota bacterium]
MQEAIKKADVLIEALPYIRAFHNKVVVIKYGGSILGEEKIRKGVLEDIVFMNFMGLKTVLVHGGGPNISDRMRQSGKKTDFVDGMRVTDEQTLKVVEEELQKLNTMIVNEITELGCHAIGLNGKENKLLASEKKKANIDLGLVGHVTGVNTKAIFDELDKDKVVVILPMGAGGDGKTYNVNADEAAANVAESMKAEKLVILTNVKGIMRAPDDPSSFMSTLTREDAKQLMEQKVIQTGMIPKVQACIHAVTKGVKKTHMVDACIPHALLLEIFTDQGIGTEIIS